MQLVLSAPALYSLELTPLCNNRCPGCFNVFIDDKLTRPMRDIPKPLTALQWRAVLEQIRPHVERLKLTGGEPTLHPEFEAIVRTIDELGLSFSLFTNARWHQPDRLLQLLKASRGFSGFLISLHGARAETHEAYSGIQGSFEETVKNIRAVSRAGLLTATSTVISRQNYSGLADIVTLALDLGADHAVINRYLGQPLEEVEPTPDQLRVAVLTVDHLRKQGVRVKFGNCIPGCFVENSSTGCLAGSAYCAIDPWGNLRPCNHSPTIVGNILEQPIETLWRSARMEAWRGLMPDECTSCSLYSNCHGACRALIEVSGEKRDPLRGSPVVQKPAPARLTLYEGLRPMRDYHLRQEEYGMVLMGGNRIVPIDRNDMPILEMCDGVTTLRQIQKQFGARGLILVSQLEQRGLIRFATQEAASALPGSECG